MSCGRLPHSVNIRLAVTQAASAILATRGGGSMNQPTPENFEAMAGKMLAFVLGKFTVEQIDKIESDGGPAARARFLDSPIESLSCNALIRNKLHVAGVRSIRALTEPGIRMANVIAGMAPDEIDCLSAELQPHGLRLAMQSIEIAQWTAHGAPGQEG